MSEMGGWKYLPAPPDPYTYSEVGRYTIESETFQVLRRVDGTSFRYNWLTGPNKGYGFVTGDENPGPTEPTEDWHREAIREFLSAIDPATGYLTEED